MVTKNVGQSFLKKNPELKTHCQNKQLYLNTVIKHKPLQNKTDTIHTTHKMKTDYLTLQDL